MLVDTQGLLMAAIVHAADIQDPSGDCEAASLRESRDGGVLLVATLFGLHPFLRKLYADGGYQGPQSQAGLARAMRQVKVEIVKRPDAVKGFTVLPKRWIVEVDVAAEPVELGHQHLPAMATGCGQGCRELRPAAYGLRSAVCGLRSNASDPFPVSTLVNASATSKPFWAANWAQRSRLASSPSPDRPWRSVLTR